MFGVDAKGVFDGLRGHRRLNSRTGDHGKAAQLEGLAWGQDSPEEMLSLRTMRAIKPFIDVTVALSMKAPMSVSKPADLG